MAKNIIVLGGGTAGLMTALIIKKLHPSLNIKIIRSSNLGIIGVGEGSTEHFKWFVDVMGISLPELFRETEATYKQGIKFTNWNGDGKHYFHSLLGVQHDTCPNGYQIGIATQYVDDVPFFEIESGNIFYPYDKNSIHQFHFQTFKLNEYLQKLCVNLDIKIVDDLINDVILDQQGYVNKLMGEESNYKADLFLDCSGFRRIVSKKLGVKWVSRIDNLPMNRAIAFPSPREEDIPLYTESTALSSGWMWRIPTQNQFGNGYVFNDNFISLENAIKEIKEHTGLDIKKPRDIEFEAGHVDTFWINNCVSIGLSGSFVEPLEASSIGSTIIQARMLSDALNTWSKETPHAAKAFNDRCYGLINNIIDFVQLHYMTKRDDSEFWKDKQIKLTDFNQHYLELFKLDLPTDIMFNDYSMFHANNFSQILTGIRLIHKKQLMQTIQNNHYNEYSKRSRLFSKIQEEMQARNSVSHRDFLGLM